MRIRAKLYYIVLGTLVLATSRVTAKNADAQEPLRWKFETGQKLNYNMTHDTSVGVSGGPFDGQNAKVHHEMTMLWDIVEASKDGAVIRQKFDRVHTKMETSEGTVEYDTASDEPPVGQAAALAPLYKALTEAEFELTMTARGEIKEVKIPEKLLEALKNSPNATALGDLTTPEGFKKMMSQGALVLPEEAPQLGKESTTRTEATDPLGGKQIVETTYRYDGTKQIDGVTYAVFLSSMKMTYEGDDQLKIKEQDSSGEVLFNIGAGRMHSSKLDQKITIEQAAGVQTAIDQSIVFEVKLVE